MRLLKKGDDSTFESLILNSKGNAVNRSHPVSAICVDNRKRIRRITDRERIPNWQNMRVPKGCPEAHIELDDASGLVSSVVASLTIRRVSTSAWRSAITTLHLVRTSISTSTTRNTSSGVRHLAILGSHAWTALATIALIASTSWTWGTHWRLLIGIA